MDVAAKNKMLMIDPLRCNGCKECENACAIAHAGNRKIARKRIEVLSLSKEEHVYVPSTCRQCTEPPCMTVCPRKAISRDSTLDRVVIDTRLCVGCMMCVSACPTGSMAFAQDLGLPYKCDLCDGDPKCAKVCEPKAITFIDHVRAHYPKIRESARNMLGYPSRPRHGNM
ncbi:MAG: 4Fe-4S dicluster domain-containing protein [Syntrophorhabdaceae bacterium]|nr:4Fe-4S dicluster domain-containing protein [Syntrophorhabdaceae bacterium]